MKEVRSDMVMLPTAKKGNLVSMVEVKQLAKNKLPANSALLTLILSQPDYLQIMSFVIKVEDFLNLLYDELKR